ncbi:hypothetical protein PO909_018163 [Leuciscus waleckii]
MGGKCLLARCKNLSGLHWFPRDADRARLWLQAVGWPSTPDTSRLFVCNKHFSRESFYRHEDYGIAHGGKIRREDTDKSLKYLSIPTGQPFHLNCWLEILEFCPVTVAEGGSLNMVIGYVPGKRLQTELGPTSCEQRIKSTPN